MGINLHKGICASRPASVQLLIFLLLVSAGAIFSSLLSTVYILLTQGLETDMTQNPNLARVIQLIASIGTFLLPALGMAWLCSASPKQYLSIRGIKDPRTWILTFVCMLLLTPVINLLGLLNQQMELPAFLAPVEEWMRAQEDLAERLTMTLLSDNHVEAIIANLIVIALAAGITEEFLFRGALQRVIGKYTTNPHTVIWIAATLFSAFHLQFYGFLPRMLLGAYFGYLLYWGKSIWLPVFAHFTNNAVAVIGMSDSHWKDSEFITGDIPPEHLLDFTLMATASLLLFLLANRLLRRTL